MRARSILIATALLSTVHARDARAQTTRSPFEWIAPEGCPDEREVRAAIERQLGRPVDATLESIATVRAEIRHRENGWTAMVTTHTPSGDRERVAEDARCEALADAVALIAVLAWDGQAPRDVGSGSPGSSEPASSAPAVPPNFILDPERADAPPRSRIPVRAVPSWTPPRRGIYLHADGFVDRGTLPAATLGLSIGAGLFVRGWRFGAKGLVLLPQTASEPIAAQWGVRVALYSAAIESCHLWVTRWVDGGACAEIDLGAMVGDGIGLVGARTDAGFYFAAGLSGNLAFRFTDRIALRLEATPIVTIGAPAFYTSGSSQPLFQPSLFAIRGGAGLEASF